MKTQIYLPLLDSSKKYLKLKKVYRYHMKKIADMSDNEIIQACHRYVEENHLNDEWKAFRTENEQDYSEENAWRK